MYRKQAVLSIAVFALGRRVRRTDSTSYDSGLHRQWPEYRSDVLWVQHNWRRLL